jgi:hypothetical protein
MLRRFLVLISVLAVALSMIGLSALRASADETPPTLSPAQGPAGTHVTASATDWPGCSSMSVSGWGQTTLGTAAVSSSGAFTLSFTVPGNAPLGAAQLVFMPTCSHSTILTVATFTVTQGTPPPPSCSPSVSLTPNSGAVGSKFVMAGKGWLPGGTVTITLPSTAPGFFESTTPFTPKVAADGTWKLTAIVGKPSSAGGYTFTFAESGCASKTGTFTVTAPTPPPPPPPPPPVPSCAPSVSISPSSGPLGSTFVVTGKGWVGGSAIKISPPGLSNFQANSFTPKPDANGSWRTTVNVNPSSPGSYMFVFTQNGCPSQSAAFTVTLPKSSCSSVWLVGARGSGEPALGDDGMGPELFKMATVLATDLRAKGKHLQPVPVFYPADSVNELIPGSASQIVQDLLGGLVTTGAVVLYEKANINKYQSSINQGIQSAEQMVGSILRLCPGAKIVLAGYSQGAIAVHEAENWLKANKPGELSHIVGTLLLGDPDRVVNTGTKKQRVTEFGTSKTPASGTAPVGLRVALHLVKAQQVPLPGSTANIANTDDIVGDFSWSHFEGKSIAQVGANFQKAVRVHTSYANDPALTAAVNWVASKIH